MVVLNPNFIKYANENAGKYNLKPQQVITGLGNGKFDEYFKKFEIFYEKFAIEKKESILLYAVEFKFFRHEEGGDKNQKKLIELDIQKLNLLTKVQIHNSNIPFCENSLTICFVEKDVKKKLRETIERMKDECEKLEIITKK
jgi:hypothetical protein